MTISFHIYFQFTLHSQPTVTFAAEKNDDPFCIFCGWRLMSCHGPHWIMCHQLSSPFASLPFLSLFLPYLHLFGPDNKTAVSVFSCSLSCTFQVRWLMNFILHDSSMSIGLCTSIHLSFGVTALSCNLSSCSLVFIWWNYFSPFTSKL
jgi:hypothetical protein